MAALKVDVDCFQDKCSSDYLRVFLEVCQFISTVISVMGHAFDIIPNGIHIGRREIKELYSDPGREIGFFSILRVINPCLPCFALDCRPACVEFELYVKRSIKCVWISGFQEEPPAVQVNGIAAKRVGRVKTIVDKESGFASLIRTFLNMQEFSGYRHKITSFKRFEKHCVTP